MQPKTTDFETRATHFLENLAEKLDMQAGDAMDIDFVGGILTLELEDGRQYLLNKHQPMQQVWLSSPVSGAWHFNPAPDPSDWFATRGGRSLLGLLSEELKALLGREVDL